MLQEEYIDYLKNEKKTSINTVDAYRRDINAFIVFLLGRGMKRPEEACSNDVVAYLMELKTENKTRSTVNRKLASIRSFYGFLLKNKYIEVNPAEDIKSPRIERNSIEYLSMEEVDILLSTPDKSIKGIRDKAIMELMYATGIRVSEVIELHIEDVNLRMGFVACNGEHGKARIIPIGSMAKQALEDYLMSSRDNLLRDNTVEKPLFVNCFGEKMTRQGLWKVLRQYGQEAGIEEKLTPQILRNSFAAHMIQNGADLKSLQELLGHEDIMATQIFLTVKKSRIKDVYDRTHPRA